jgi:hypothetical protein
MRGDIYDVLPLPVKISDEIRKQNPHFKPFVAVYFPAEMLAEMKWTDNMKLHLTIEKDGLKITANEPGIENFTTNELVYVPLDEDEW